MMTYKEMQDLAEKLDEYFRKNGMFETVYADHRYIAVEINWGDWKHDHIRCKYLIERFFRVTGKNVSIQTEVTEEDGSDCYSAIHRIYVA